MKIRVKFTFSDPTGIRLDDEEGMTITDETMLLDLLGLFFAIAKEYTDKGWVVSDIVWDEEEPEVPVPELMDIIKIQYRYELTDNGLRRDNGSVVDLP